MPNRLLSSIVSQMDQQDQRRYQDNLSQEEAEIFLGLRPKPLQRSLVPRQRVDNHPQELARLAGFDLSRLVSWARELQRQQGRNLAKELPMPQESGPGRTLDPNILKKALGKLGVLFKKKPLANSAPVSRK